MAFYIADGGVDYIRGGGPLIGEKQAYQLRQFGGDNDLRIQIGGGVGMDQIRELCCKFRVIPQVEGMIAAVGSDDVVKNRLKMRSVKMNPHGFGVSDGSIYMRLLGFNQKRLARVYFADLSLCLVHKTAGYQIDQLKNGSNAPGG